MSEKQIGEAAEPPVCAEFRVIWQREGQAKKRALYQTRKAATACAERQRSARDEMDWLPHPLPEIVYGPVIECREVGAWVALTRAPLAPPQSDSDGAGTDTRAGQT